MGLSSFLFALFIGGSNADSIRGVVSPSDASSAIASNRDVGDASRHLEVEDFVPLQCNSRLDSAVCTSWEQQFGNGNVHLKKITIPCGECVTMDHKGYELILLEGIDIHGKLVFPDNYYLDLKVPLIAVQGELKITSTKAVNGQPSVTITMIDNTRTGQKTFTAIERNANKCAGTSICETGEKAIVVAGGKVNRKYGW